ncbi:mycofactocin-coupled SDR family oxidoreductase [Rhodococcus sp. 14C212]|uniref:mycofactocin-coupled SDR family oxidoreductase n=1 Tax=Rhodococcus sp. 14C212 TaxID=2711209 RepID=UPI0009D4BEA1|nr:mycofactocin-coupled SDR family oxidoreductase [Rhodococcus sp. 14C212]NGP07266.1 mycofactocin-coupled SDR family oxidoreductase [Rhodococcus sp. 14C212]OOL33034.1 3-ketoacyl-ACP reductase [Rhodococcus rhodochrous]
MGRVEGKVALVTGAARGQGRSHALRFAQEGADVVILDACTEIDSVPYPLPTEVELKETEALVAATGRRVLARTADVRSQEQLDAVVDEALAEFGHIDIVAANAGIVGFRPTWELSDTEWQDMLDVNLTGAFHTVKAVVPAMIEAGHGGSIVITSSIQAMLGSANIAHYNASKSGVMGLMRTLAAELGPHGIRVNTVNPSAVETPMLLNDATFRIFGPDLDNPGPEDLWERSKDRNPMGVGWVSAAHLSNAVLFLASDEAQFITGVALPVDMGVRL